MRQKYPRPIIFRVGDVSWPPRSSDLTTLDYFLGGYMKKRDYKNNLESVPEVRDNIFSHK